ncbi:hypothetical protein BDN72DRAFT_840418 [Pluteus cervinus]|uniref:Uncharacterized protein n=1 Tax=Pluteus cervinus TaxID=181527 RepID=A0ACD3AUK0_9AGAR|nr:hypothetical protein BDN72DRAFT_840418 [Pluteus cervinus]
MPRFALFQSLVILSVFFATQGVLGAAANGAGLTCNNFQLIGSGTDASIQASCTTDNGDTTISSILISDCVLNGNGNPGCLVNGGAAGSCTFSSLDEVSATDITVETSCTNDAQGKDVTPGFNIGACLTNTNGILTC